MVAKVEAVVQITLHPTRRTGIRVKIYVSMELTRDMKDLRFGYRNEKTYGKCHRISPITMLQVSMEQQNKRRFRSVVPIGQHIC